MSRFNKTTKGYNRTVNFAGGEAYSMPPEIELYTLVCTFMMQDTYYETNDERIQRLESLIKQCDPLFVSKLAVYAREHMYLRTVPIIITVLLIKNTKNVEYLWNLVFRVIQRPDEITEMLACYQKFNQRNGTKKLNKLSNQLKKGIRAVFETAKFDEYQYAKYNRKTEIRFRDAMFLTHPRPFDSNQKRLFEAIANNTLNTPDTWEVGISKCTSKEEKRSVFERLIDEKRMGYMAILRNLRNFLINDVSADHIQKVCDYISNERNVLHSKQMPFRFLAAYRSITPETTDIPGLRYNTYNGIDENDIRVKMLQMALEKAVKYSVSNVKLFDTDNILLATDVSGSMQQPVSKNSKILMYDIGTVLCMMMKYKYKNAKTGIFGSKWMLMDFGSDNILHNAQLVHDEEGKVGYRTNAYKIINYCISENEKFDKIFVFTDTQVYDSDLFYYEDVIKFQNKWEEYKRMNKDAKLYIFDLCGTTSTPVDIRRNDVVIVSGYSDRMFDMLASIEQGSSIIEEINNVNF